jgi:thiosulfate/3-mercaptopyruvate sulfurtransferase
VSGRAPPSLQQHLEPRMSHRTLIPATTLLELQAAGTTLVLLDCGFDLADPEAGERAYAAAHLPGALYLHLDRDLSGALNGRNGRHPLPLRGAFAATAGRCGVVPGLQVVCYDAQGGPYAARAWWLWRWLGHEAAAVLDGGPAAYVAAGGRLVDEPTATRNAGPYPERRDLMPVIDAESLRAALGRLRPLDARAPERFRGDVEPLDPVAGHIPGATNRFFKDNLLPDGRFKPAAMLRDEYLAYGSAAGDVVHHCGSGVTACHNLLAMCHAGLEGSRLYPGSWSEWCADPARPVERG